MDEKIFAVMGATGHIGRVITEDLLKRGHTVRAIGRDIEKLHQLNLKGANLVITEFDDPEILTQAFQDSYAVFTMIPPAYQEKNFLTYQDHLSQIIVEALTNSKAERVVNLSSIGADLPSGTGPIVGLHKLEQKLDALKNLTTLIHLRPGYFMENLNGFLPMVLNQRSIHSPLKGDLPIPMVATRDIGWKAADFMDSTSIFPHLIFEFLGPKSVTMNDVAEVFATCLDMPELRYEHISYDDARKECIKNRMSEELIDTLFEMYEAFNTNKIVPKQDLSQAHHGTTTIEAYIQHLTHRLIVHHHS